ncbi:hypothetical protein Tsubulata_028226 [Turnera subulata]|uniref:Uncharacterized protein n=1 Tax=Turnera subulata TaxID=218843 RepID=A0A9Q0G978_9ROSI|nr:hypothetical protein Tsubulata_028226 [Turnera subulata]
MLDDSLLVAKRMQLCSSFRKNCSKIYYSQNEVPVNRLMMGGDVAKEAHVTVSFSIQRTEKCRSIGANQRQTNQRIITLERKELVNGNTDTRC